MNNEKEKTGNNDELNQQRDSQSQEIKNKQSFNNDSGSMIPGNKEKEEEEEKQKSDSNRNENSQTA